MIQVVHAWFCSQEAHAASSLRSSSSSWTAFFALGSVVAARKREVRGNMRENVRERERERDEGVAKCLMERR